MKTKASLNQALFMLAASALLLASCAAFGSRGDSGAVKVTLGGSAGAKALGDDIDFYPSLPIFKSATLTVSGPDMAAVSTTVALDSDSPESVTLSLDVPAGSDRVVELYAPVDWEKTAAYYSDQEYTYPTLALAYGGRATVDVSASGTTTASIALQVVETKMILPNSGDVYVYTADSMSGVSTATSLTMYNPWSNYFAFDRYGRLFVTNSDGFGMYTDPAGSITTASTSVTTQCPVAYSLKDACVYFAAGETLTRMDLSNDTTSTVSLPVSFSSMNGVAVDDDGYVYIAGNNGSDDVVTKLLISGTEASLEASATYASLGLVVDAGNLTVKDMTVKDDGLYMIGAEYSSESGSHGKLIEASLSNLSKVRELGWCSTGTPTDPSTQFYWPQRFVGLAPHKLRIADEGYESGDTEVNRVVEVDLDSWKFDALRTESTASLFFPQMD